MRSYVLTFQRHIATTLCSEWKQRNDIFIFIYFSLLCAVHCCPLKIETIHLAMQWARGNLDLTLWVSAAAAAAAAAAAFISPIAYHFALQTKMFVNVIFWCNRFATLCIHSKVVACECATVALCSWIVNEILRYIVASFTRDFNPVEFVRRTLPLHQRTKQTIITQKCRNRTSEHVIAESVNNAIVIYSLLQVFALNRLDVATRLLPFDCDFRFAIIACAIYEKSYVRRRQLFYCRQCASSRVRLGVVFSTLKAIYRLWI